MPYSAGSTRVDRPPPASTGRVRRTALETEQLLTLVPIGAEAMGGRAAPTVPECPAVSRDYVEEGADGRDMLYADSLARQSPSVLVPQADSTPPRQRSAE